MSVLFIQNIPVINRLNLACCHLFTHFLQQVLYCALLVIWLLTIIKFFLRVTDMHGTKQKINRK